MARTVEEVQEQIIAAKNADSNLSSLTSDSHRAIWRAWTRIIALAIVTLEQLKDLWVSEVEAIVARSSPANKLWIQNKMFEFQYDATSPQIVQLIGMEIKYPTIDATKRIITACSPVTDVNNTVNIKVAKGSPYVKLSTSEKSAAQDYINTLGTAGITYNVISEDADRLYIEADIYFKGQYSAVIKTTVIDTLNAYYQKLSLVNFDGSLKMSDLESVIRNVEGVEDVVLKNVKGRPNAIAFPGGTYFIQNNAVVQRLWRTAAGYLVQEDTAGSTYNETLNFIAQ